MRIREESRSGLEIVLVDIWEGTEPRPEVERFCEMWGIKGPILLDPDLELAGALGVRGVPTNVVVDSDGTIRAFGAARLEELEQAIDELYGREMRCHEVAALGLGPRMPTIARRHRRMEANDGRRSRAAPRVYSR